MRIQQWVGLQVRAAHHELLGQSVRVTKSQIAVDKQQEKTQAGLGESKESVNCHCTYCSLILPGST